MSEITEILPEDSVSRLFDSKIHVLNGWPEEKRSKVFNYFERVESLDGTTYGKCIKCAKKMKVDSRTTGNLKGKIYYLF